MRGLFDRLYQSDDGLDLAEYAMLAGLIALVCIAVIMNLGQSVDSALDNADSQLRADGGV